MTKSKHFEYELCKCLERIQKKYIDIRNNATRKDDAIEENVSFFKEFEPNLAKAKLKYSSNYLIEILACKHRKNCNGQKWIQHNTEVSKKFHSAQQEILTAENFKLAVDKLRNQYSKQVQLCEDELKNFTSDLAKIPLKHYWNYFNSNELSKLLFGLIEPTLQIEFKTVFPGLVQREVVLIQILENNRLTDNLWQTLATDNKWFGTSAKGELINMFNHYQKLKHRVSESFRPRQLSAMITNYEKILPFLTEPARKRAQSEYERLLEIAEKQG